MFVVLHSPSSHSNTKLLLYAYRLIVIYRDLS